MSWNQHHSLSETLAAAAEEANRMGNIQGAEELYRRAAVAEVEAFDHLTIEKVRTRGITAVSAVALWYKGHDYVSAERLAHRYLSTLDLPSFAEAQLRELLHIIWTARAAQEAGIKFVRGDVLVSVKGGVVIYGGAPLDLIIRKVEGIQSVLFRTVEMLLNRPFRKRGAPSLDIQSMFRPWLFQAPAGSYQFAVRVQEPEQQHLWNEDRPRIDKVTSTFLDVLRASASDPETQLPEVVPDPQYREAFLSLSRNLAPTGKTFNRLEIRDASAPAAPVASFVVETRQHINTALRKTKIRKTEVSSDEQLNLRGVLRAVHLDEDWLEVTTIEQQNHYHIEGISEVLDDVVGPMINRSVVVTAVRRGNKYLYRDIELEE